MVAIRIKKHIERFYDAATETVFALYEDIDGNVHYQSIGYDTDRQQMLSQQFYRDFTRSDLQASRRV